MPETAFFVAVPVSVPPPGFVPTDARDQTAADRRTMRTPLVPEPLLISLSEVYELLCVSVHETVPEAGSIAKATMILFPAATPDAGTVIEVEVPGRFGRCCSDRLNKCYLRRDLGNKGKGEQQ